MSTDATDDSDANGSPAPTHPSGGGLGALAVAGFASIGAGAIHAAAVGVHSEHRQAALVFVAVAAFQIVWGALALHAVVAMAGPARRGRQRGADRRLGAGQDQRHLVDRRARHRRVGPVRRCARRRPGAGLGRRLARRRVGGPRRRRTTLHQPDRRRRSRRRDHRPHGPRHGIGRQPPARPRRCQRHDRRRRTRAHRHRRQRHGHRRRCHGDDGARPLGDRHRRQRRPRTTTAPTRRRPWPPSPTTRPSRSTSAASPASRRNSRHVPRTWWRSPSSASRSSPIRRWPRPAATARSATG